jgi:hypothetical protein
MGLSSKHLFNSYKRAKNTRLGNKMLKDEAFDLNFHNICEQCKNDAKSNANYACTLNSITRYKTYSV